VINFVKNQFSVFYQKFHQLLDFFPKAMGNMLQGT